jgi:hypothetical protein
VYGWKVNFDKVSFTKFLRKEFGYSLSVAKDITDGILEEKAVTLEMEENGVQRIAVELEKLRASFSVG